MQDTKLYGRSYEDIDSEVISIDRASFNQGKNAKYDISIGGYCPYDSCERSWCSLLPKTIGSLCARDYKGVGNQYVEEGKVIIQCMKWKGGARMKGGNQEYIVRRLTPL